MKDTTPKNGTLYVVRWVRLDGRVIKHRHFTRQHDAQQFLDKVRAAGRQAAMYRSRTDWEQVRA